MNAEQLRALPEWTVLTSHRPDGSYYTCLIKSNVDEWDAAYETHSSAEVASWGHALTIVARPVTTPCTCREDVACGACMSGATDPTTATVWGDTFTRLILAIAGNDPGNAAANIMREFNVTPKREVQR